MHEGEGMSTASGKLSKKGITPRTLLGAGLGVTLLAVSYSLVEAQGLRGGVLAGGTIVALCAGAVELRRQLALRRQQTALQIEALESIAREAATLPIAARALEEASERVSVLEQRLAESHSEATRETVSVVRSGLLEFQSAMKMGIEEAARVGKQALAPMVEEAVRSTITASAENAERLLERVEQDSEARRESEARHFEKITHAADQLIELLESQGALETRQQERAASLIEGIERASETLHNVGREQREALEATAAASIEHTRAFDEQAAARFESLAALVNQGSEDQGERLARFEERLAEAQRSGASSMVESLATATQQLGESLSATGEAVRSAAELVQAGGAEMTAVAEQFGASVERQREAANQWLESLGQIEGAVDDAGRGAATDALDARLAATQEIFATQLEFQRELFRQLRDLGERIDDGEAEALPGEDEDLSQSLNDSLNDSEAAEAKPDEDVELDQSEAAETLELAGSETEAEASEEHAQ
jgi:hypothetical protein